MIFAFLLGVKQNSIFFKLNPLFFFFYIFTLHFNTWVYLVMYTFIIFYTLRMSRQIFRTSPPLCPWYFMYSFERVLSLEYKVELCTQCWIFQVWCFCSCTAFHTATTTQTNYELFHCHFILSVALNSDIPKHQAMTHNLPATGVLIMLCHVDVQSLFSFHIKCPVFGFSKAL